MMDKNQREDAQQAPESQSQGGYAPPAYVRAAREAKPSWVMSSTQRIVYGIIGAVVILVLLGACIGVIITVSGNNNSSSNGSPQGDNGTTTGAITQTVPTDTSQPVGTPTPTFTPAPTDTATPRPTSTPRPQPKTVLDLTGNGIKTSDNFTVSGTSQTLNWQCDHSSFDGLDYNVQAYVYDASTHQLVLSGDAVPLNTMCQSNYTSDSTKMHLDPGTYYIEMNSEGWWHITITDNP